MILAILVDSRPGRMSASGREEPPKRFEVG